MPTVVSASQFTQFKRTSAYQNQKRDGGIKMITHLYQPRVTTTGLTDFLTNPNASDRHYSGFYKTTAMKMNQNYSYAAPKYIK
jgi:hypothetical protein